MARKVIVNGEKMAESYVLDKIREYELCLAGIPDDFQYKLYYWLKSYEQEGFRHYEQQISIPRDTELIESILDLIRKYCAKQIELYKKALKEQ